MVGKRDDMSKRAAVTRFAVAVGSLSDASNLCDITPSRFKRFDRDEYFTIDAAWIIPAL
jgi:hypothetical protein